MAQYEVLAQSFIGNRLVEAGTIVEVNDDPKKGGMTPGSNLKKVSGASAPKADGNAETGK